MDCGLLVKTTPLKFDTLTAMYRNSWRAPNEHVEETGGTDTKLALRLATRLLESLGRQDFSGLTLLDFGAGKGEFLRVLQNLGANVYGVDPFACDHLRGLGFKVFPDLRACPKSIHFDGAVAIDVIEHLPRPWEQLKLLRERLTPRGWLYLTTPNARSAAARIRGARWKEAAKPGHLLFFSGDSLSRILEYSGFQQARRLRGRVEYTSNTPQKAIQSVLQFLGWDGQLKYLAMCE